MVDGINALFELGAGLILCFNCAIALKDKSVGGVRWYTQGFFALWAVWNVAFYMFMGTKISMWVAAASATVYIVWITLLWRYRAVKLR